MKIGSRIRFTHDVDRYPHFIAPKGATGTVVDSGDPGLVAVLLDAHLPGAEDWDNQVHWYIPNGDDPTTDVELLDAAGETKKTKKRYLDFRFDVTDLTDEEIGFLAGEVSAQAESSFKQWGNGEGHPTVAVESEVVEVEQDAA